MEEENAKVIAQVEEISNEYRNYKDYAEKRFESADQQLAEIEELLLSMQGSTLGAPLGADRNTQNVGAEKGQQVQSSSSENRLQVDQINPIEEKKPQKKNQGQGTTQRSSARNQQHATDNTQDLSVTEPMVQNQQLLPSENRVHVDEINMARVRKLPQKQVVKEVALRLPSGTKIVARGRLISTDKTAKGQDGLPLGEFYEVLVDFVLDQNVILSRVHGKPMKLSAAIGHCILWPRQNVVQPDGSALIMHRNRKDN